MDADQDVCVLTSRFHEIWASFFFLFLFHFILLTCRIKKRSSFIESHGNRWLRFKPQELATKLSRSFDMKEESGNLLGGNLRRHQVFNDIFFHFCFFMFSRMHFRFFSRYTFSQCSVCRVNIRMDYQMIQITNTIHTSYLIIEEIYTLPLKRQNQY